MYIEKKQNSKCGNLKLSIFTVLWIWISIFCKDLSSDKWLRRKFFLQIPLLPLLIITRTFYVDNDYGNICNKDFHARKNILFDFGFWSQNVTRYNFPFLSPRLFPSDLIWEQDREKKSRSGKEMQTGKINHQPSNLKNEVIQNWRLFTWDLCLERRQFTSSSFSSTSHTRKTLIYITNYFSWFS